MRRTVSCRIEADVAEPADVVLSVSVASGLHLDSESLVAGVGVDILRTREIVDDHGTRLHVLEDVGTGRLVVTYQATASGTGMAAPVGVVDRIRYLRPSRYCESDRLTALARDTFRGLHGANLVRSVSSWVGQRVAYVPGSSRPTDGAVSTLLAREGVCRDFAHLVIALLRACDVPARLVSVYAPGLAPMDFHAVSEALVDGRWIVVDATCLAPRSSLVRIATGRDAADTAFLTSTGTKLALLSLDVNATTDADIPTDDLSESVQLG